MLATTAEIVEDFRNQRMAILVETGAAGDVGVLVAPAQSVGPDAITFMARYCRGIVMLALTAERVAALRLPQMATHNSAFYQQAFTTSIEARTGVTTGISAPDRARTIQVAIDPAYGPGDIVTPGHVFPVAASEGGVLARSGYTEAAIDLMKLAGLNLSAAMCGILNEDGAMATMGQLETFAREHDLKIGTIGDLIAQRCRDERLVDCISCERFQSDHGGEWELRVYRNRIDGWEHLALVKGRLDQAPVRVVVHALSLFDDILVRVGDRAGRIPRAMNALSQQEGGVLLLIREPGPLFPQAASEEGAARPYARAVLGRMGVAEQILSHLGLSSVVLLDEDEMPVHVLAGHGIEIAGVEPL